MDDQMMELEKIIRENWNQLNKSQISNPDFVAGTIRVTLEAMVKLFWLKRYGRIPIFVKNGNDIGFNLCMAIDSNKFSSFFNKIIINDMHLIRKVCNDSLHTSSNLQNAEITVKDAAEILERLEKCIKAIQEKINIDIIPVGVEIATLATVLQQPIDTAITKDAISSEDEKAKKFLQQQIL